MLWKQIDIRVSIYREVLKYYQSKLILEVVYIEQYLNTIKAHDDCSIYILYKLAIYKYLTLQKYREIMDFKYMNSYYQYSILQFTNSS